MGKVRRRAPRLARGQLVIPALFVLPSLVLFLYLIFETAKISKEKIMHQFAVDSAAFIELTNYSDLLNRSAYVNGAFPMRVWLESYPYSITMDTMNGSGSAHMMDLLYQNGVFPAYAGNPSENPGSLDSTPRWPIAYSPASAPPIGSGSVLNNGKSTSAEDAGTQHVFTQKQAEVYSEWYDIHAVPIWQFFGQVYNLLGSVESAQVQVYQRLSSNQAFYKKSWMLNTGENQGGADASAFLGKMLNIGCLYNSKSGTYGKYQKPTWWDIYGTQGFGSDPDAKGGSPPFSYPGSGESYCGSGLFRVATISQGELAKVHIGYGGGVDVQQHWTAQDNYFQVPLNVPAKPFVHAKVGIVGCCVWAEEGAPTPTPKFQVREFP